MKKYEVCTFEDCEYNEITVTLGRARFNKRAVIIENADGVLATYTNKAQVQRIRGFFLAAESALCGSKRLPEMPKCYDLETQYMVRTLTIENHATLYIRAGGKVVFVIDAVSNSPMASALADFCGHAIEYLEAK